MTPDEFAAKIKAKYPDYADMDNTELSRRIVAKHPEYASQVDFSDGLKDSVAAPKSEGLLSRAANFISEEGVPVGGAMIGGALSAPLAVASGPFAPAVLAGGAAIGAAGARGLQRTYQYAAGLRDIPSTGEAVSDIGAAAAGGVVNELGGPIASKAVGALARPTVKLGSQVVRALTGTPEKSAAALLRDPSILGRALPIDEAGAAYGNAVGGLKSGAEAARESLGKSHFSGEAIADKFDEMADAIKTGTIDTQTALALRQRTMKAIEDLPFNQRDLKRLLADNIEQLDGILEKRLPEWSGAKTGYRESKIAEDFSSWLPLNKNLSPNVLRTTAAIAAAGKGLVEGRPWLAAGLPLISPKIWGKGIQAAGLTAQAMTSAPARVTYRVGVQSLADEYASRRNAP